MVTSVFLLILYPITQDQGRKYLYIDSLFPHSEPGFH